MKLHNTEKIVADYYRKQGYKIFRNGYPDFLLYKEKENKCLFVEVKSWTGATSKNQKMVHNILRKIGFEVKLLRVKNGEIFDTNPIISKYYSELGKKSAAAREKKLLLKAKVAQAPASSGKLNKN